MPKTNMEQFISPVDLHLQDCIAEFSFTFQQAPCIIEHMLIISKLKEEQEVFSSVLLKTLKRH